MHDLKSVVSFCHDHGRRSALTRSHPHHPPCVPLAYKITRRYIDNKFVDSVKEHRDETKA